MERVYTDKGFISKYSTLNVLGNDSKFSLLLPVSEMPETRTAPDQVDKTVFSILPGLCFHTSSHQFF